MAVIKLRQDHSATQRHATIEVIHRLSTGRLSDGHQLVAWQFDLTQRPDLRKHPIVALRCTLVAYTCGTRFDVALGATPRGRVYVVHAPRVAQATASAQR